jgi:NADH-quinone oxidoreductase subunit M
VAAVVAAGGVILAAVYLLWAYERVFTGPIVHKENSKLIDLDRREILIIAPLVALIVFLGVYPKPALDRIEPAVEEVLERIEQATDYTVPEFGTPEDLANVGGGQ